MTSINRSTLPSIHDATWYVVQPGGRKTKLPGCTHKVNGYARYIKCGDLLEAAKKGYELSAGYRANCAASEFQRREWRPSYVVIGVLDVQPHEDAGIDKGHTVDPHFCRELYQDEAEVRAEHAELGRVRTLVEQLEAIQS